MGLRPALAFPLLVSLIDLTRRRSRTGAASTFQTYR
jgi:hypothetical protein